MILKQMIFNLYMNDLKRQAIYTYIHNSDESDEIVDLSDMDK